MTYEMPNQVTAGRLAGRWPRWVRLRHSRKQPHDVGDVRDYDTGRRQEPIRIRPGGDMTTEVEVEAHFYSAPCACPDHSWAFPVLADLVLEDELGVNAHWVDGVGWSPCRNWEDLEAPDARPLEQWSAVALRATAAANQLPLEHWRTLWAQWLDSELVRAEQLLQMAERIVVKERNQRLVAECRVVAARIADPELSAAAHRLLTQNWTGTPAELLATAEALVS